MIFKDKILFDGETKTAISVRDGSLEYMGQEIGLEPFDKIFRVYRSPATISNIAFKMSDLAVTDDHVDIDSEPTNIIGSIKDAEMVDLFDNSNGATLGIKNKILVKDENFLSQLSDGNRELSLGYLADLVKTERDGYDLEQRNIQPHHLAVVDAGRCGDACAFLDKQKRGKEMVNTNKNTRFFDEEGAMSIKEMVELIQRLPEILSELDGDQLAQVMPVLKQVATPIDKDEKEADQEAGEAEGDLERAEEKEMGDEEDPEEADEKKEMMTKDSAEFKDAMQKAIADHASTIEHARAFLPTGYNFSDSSKTTKQIKIDTLKTEYPDKDFLDSEIDVAFKMLRKEQSNGFEDKSPKDNLVKYFQNKEF